MKLINILLVLMGLVCTERLCANEQFNITQFKPREKQKDIIRISEAFDRKTIDKLWLSENFTLDPTGGESGTGALCVIIGLKAEPTVPIPRNNSL